MGDPSEDTDVNDIIADLSIDLDAETYFDLKTEISEPQKSKLLQQILASESGACVLRN